MNIFVGYGLVLIATVAASLSVSGFVGIFMGPKVTATTGGITAFIMFYILLRYMRRRLEHEKDLI